MLFRGVMLCDDLRLCDGSPVGRIAFRELGELVREIPHALVEPRYLVQPRAVAIGLLVDIGTVLDDAP